MRYIDNFDSLDESDEPLVIHRHGASPGRALIVLLHGLGGDRYRTWTPSGQEPYKVGLARFLYEDIDGLDLGLYAYRTGVGRLKFWESISLERVAKVLADRIREQARVYRTVILAGHSMGGILAKAAIRELIHRPDVVTMSSIRALMMLATPQAGSLRGIPIVWRLSEDGRVLKAHGKLVTAIQTTFQNQVVAYPTPARPEAFLVPTYVVAAAADNWVDEFSAGLNVDSDRTNTISANHKTAVKPETKSDDSYEWLRDRIREVISTATEALSLIPPNEQATLRGDLVPVLQAAFTYDALKLHAKAIGIQLAAIGADTASTAHGAIVDWAMANDRVRALFRLLIEERPADAGVQTLAGKYPRFGALLTSDERGFLGDCLTAELGTYEKLRLFAIATMAVELNDYLPMPPPLPATDASAYVPVFLRTADFLGKVEEVVGLALQRFQGPVVQGKLSPLLDALRLRRTTPDTGNSPFQVSDLQGKLFINRVVFRDALQDLTSDKGATRVVAINGPTRSGKSHSKFLIEYLERLGRYGKALISLEDDTPGTFTPDLLISQIIKRSGGSDKGLNLRKSRGETRDRWIKRLGDELISYANQRVQAVFVVLDGFDQPSLRADTRDLVQELLKRAATEAKLRIALLGYEPDLLPQEVSGRVRSEPITAFTENDLRQFFVQFARDQGKAAPPSTVLDALVQQVRSAVPQLQPTPERNEAVAKEVEKWVVGLKNLP